MDIFDIVIQVYQEEIERHKDSLSQGHAENYSDYKQVVGYITGLEWAKHNLKDIVNKQLYIKEE
jgi:hypothetical protein|tara:strand:- start:4974 stop:5165 length:192 start_codon:yes stop_codon:yes gene_type:complete